jgi:quinol monooxygenase YgiN
MTMKSATIASTLVLLASIGCAERALAANPPLVVIALVKVKLGSEDVFRNAAARILAPTRAEKGNRLYEFHRSPEDPREFATYEIWDTDADLAAHMAAPHMQAFFAVVGKLFEPGYPQIKKFHRLEAKAQATLHFSEPDPMMFSHENLPNVEDLEGLCYEGKASGVGAAIDELAERGLLNPLGAIFAVRAGESVDVRVKKMVSVDADLLKAWKAYDPRSGVVYVVSGKKGDYTPHYLTKVPPCAGAR